MPLTTDLFSVPDGAPVGGFQKMKSVTYGEIAGGLMGNLNYKFPVADGNDGDVITTNGAGLSIFKAIPNANAAPYNASTNTSAPPSSGQVRWNNSTQNTATIIHVSGINSDGVDIIEFLKVSYTPGNKILFQKRDDQSQFQEWMIQSFVDNTTYLSVTVSLIGSAGGNFNNNQNILMIAVSGLTSQVSQEASNRTLVANQISRNIFEIDTSGGETSITLPAIATVQGQRFTFIKTTNDANRALIFFNGVETANGFPRWQLNSINDSVTFIPNSTGWFVIILTPHIKTLSVVKDATVQAIPTGVPTVVSFQTIRGESPLLSFDNTTNFDWDPLNGQYFANVGVKILQLDNNNVVTICLRLNGNIVACAEARATAVNQDVAVRLSADVSNFGPSDNILTGTWDVTVEHDQGGDLNLDTDVLFTFWKMQRGRF